MLLVATLPCKMKRSLSHYTSNTTPPKSGQNSTKKNRSVC